MITTTVLSLTDYFGEQVHYKRIANQIGTYHNVVILAFSIQICRVSYTVDHSAALYNNNYYGDTVIIVVSFSYLYLMQKYNDNIMNTRY